MKKYTNALIAFGRELRRSRAADKISQEDVGEVFGVTKASVCCWENALKEPSFSRGLAVCKALRIDPKVLMKEIEVVELVKE